MQKKSIASNNELIDHLHPKVKYKFIELSGTASESVYCKSVYFN